jgi:predicted nucleic acid-binding protein
MPRPGIRSSRHLARPIGAAVAANRLKLTNSIVIGGKPVRDANIVATIRTHGLRRLLTHNTADFARFGALVQVEAARLNALTA